MYKVKLYAALFAVAAIVGCGSNKAAIGVIVAPPTATVPLSGSTPFTAVVTGSSTNTVTWQVCTAPPTATPGATQPNCNVPNNALGVISPTGNYTAPATVPVPPTVPNAGVVFVVASAVANPKVNGFAQVNIDSGIRVRIIPSSNSCSDNAPPTSASIAISETYQLQACVTGTAITTVNWTLSGANPIGSVSSSGLYAAPTTGTGGTVTVVATSSQDPSQSANFAINVTTAATPTIASLDPPTTEQGAVFQDVYVIGTNFLSTSTVTVNSATTNVTTTFINGTTLRARLFTPLLASANSLAIAVQAQNPNNVSPSKNLPVAPVRPGLIAASPASIPQGTSAPSTINIDGGFFSAAATSATFNGSPRPLSLLNSRQAAAILSSSDFAQAGLFPLVVQNSGVPATVSNRAAINLAITPTTPISSSAPPPVAVGNGPSAVAINAATNTAVVVNTTDGTISLINLATKAVTGPVAVGKNPTGVAVDNLLNQALVVNNADSTVSVVDLTTLAVTSVNVCLQPRVANVCPALSPLPFSVGVNPFTHRALVAYQSTNQATVIDITNPAAPVVLPPFSGAASPVSTGQHPQIAVEPRLNWVIVTPGGAGATSFVDLGSAPNPPINPSGRVPNVVGSLNITTSIQGIAINTETETALLTDPNNPALTTFGVLDDSVNPFPPSQFSNKNEVAAAVNPLTDIGVTVNASTGAATVFDMRALVKIQTVTVGANPQAVAIDPTSDTAVVVNEGGNSVSIFSLGPIRQLHITQASPVMAATSSSNLALTAIGDGFTSNSVVRLDGQSVPTSPIASTCVAGICREVTATVPAAMLSSARLYVVDVLDPVSGVSNVTTLSVIQPVAVGTSPFGVAVDSDRDIAVVTNSGDNTATFVNLTNATASAPIAVGTSPEGVAVLPRLGLALVANNASDDVTVLDLTGIKAPKELKDSSALGPSAVAINPDSAIALVTNTISNTLSRFSLQTLSSNGSTLLDQIPQAVAIDPVHNIAAVAAAGQTGTPTGNVDLVDLNSNTFTRLSPAGFQDPTGVEFDPTSGQFIVADSQNNNIVLFDPTKPQVQTPARVGIDPTSLAYNFNTSTLLTVNSASNTMSVIDLLTHKVQQILPLTGSPQFSVALDPKLGLAVLVEPNDNQVLLVPVPR